MPHHRRESFRAYTVFQRRDYKGTPEIVEPDFRVLGLFQAPAQQLPDCRRASASSLGDGIIQRESTRSQYRRICSVAASEGVMVRTVASVLGWDMPRCSFLHCSLTMCRESLFPSEFVSLQHWY